MFNKITCKKCREKVSKKHSFCPNCGNYLKPYKKPQDKEDWGMLGKEDEMSNEASPFSNSLFGGLTEKMLNKMLSSTMKMLEKEMQKSLKETENMPGNSGSNFELYINGKKVDPKNIKITQMPGNFAENKQSKQKNSKKITKVFSSDKNKKFSSLKMKEPKTTLRRLSDKIIYEISVPGVKSVEDISVVKIGNSIEIKAISEENSFFKIIPVNLNILSFELEDETIILELKE